MTVKEFSEIVGVSHQAIYKKLKGRGVALDAIKDKETGQLTQEGETLLREIYNIQEQRTNSEEQQEEEPAEVERESPPPAQKEVAKGLRNQVAELQKEVERLRNQVATLEDKEKALTEERDFLRVTLDRAQQLQALTASKIPNPAPALPAGRSHPRGLRAWWQRRKQKRASVQAQQQDEDPIL